jgi:hypothetical protein
MLYSLQALIEDKSNPPDIWSHHLLPDIIKSNAMLGSKAYRGIIHQIGAQLSASSGLKWPRFPHGVKPFPPPSPNHFVRQDVEYLQIAGRKSCLLQLIFVVFRRTLQL